MILYYMACLFLTWPLSRCADDHGLPTDKDMLDQLAIASENIAARRANDSISKRFSVHYENSNGFVPMIPSASSSYKPASPRSGHLEDEDRLNATNAVSARDNNETRNAKGLEEDLAYSSEARIFLNMPRPLTHRRSFHLQAAESNELELLKVNNDTPAVANYNDFYDNMRGETADDDDETARQRPKAIGDAQVRGYGNAYAQVRYNGAKRTVYQQEKVVADNYRPQNTVNYDGHEQSATVGPSLSRTNYRINGLPGVGSQTVDNVAEPSRTHHRLSRPVVVVEAATTTSGYKMDKAKLSSSQHSDYKTSRNMDNSVSSETLDVYNDYGGAEHSRNLSDESAEYSEHVERPRIRLHKSHRRPASSFTRKPAKEHRVTVERDNTEQRDGKVHKYGSPKLKVPQRYRAKPSEAWLNEPSEQSSDESAEDSRGTKNVKVQQTSRHTWNQISPSLEISHSSGIELDQLEKPKFVVPLKVNLVPVANFDHATALGNSQGFDVSNAMLRNHYVTAAPISAFSTTHNLAKNIGSLSDVIVGQSSFQNPTVLLSQAESKTAADSLTANYLPSTVTPLFALTSSLTPVELRNLQGKTSPPIVQQLLVQPQPTIQTFLQTPFRTSPAYQIHVNPHGLQGQNLVNHNLHGVLPTTPTLLSQPDSNPVDSHGKKNFLASASLTVAQQKQPTNSYYLQQLTNSQDTAGIETARVVPTIVQPVSLNALTVNAQQLIPTQQQQQQLHIHQLDKVKNQLDSTTSHSHHVLADGTAHLPNVGTKHVEIVNPNIKPSPIDTSVNAFATMHYPTVLTTPIPIFSTVSPITAHPVSLQSYVNSLTESGAKLAGKQVDSVELKPAQSQERPVFNPSNFVPNVDILESQNALNNKLPTNEPMQPSLNLVPLMPGGNFFKPSYTAQNELVMKPKLASDLQKYAEQMFRESLKTMYNSHKWNNDRKQMGRNSSDESDLAKLRLEVQKLRASLSDDRLREPFDAHQSENKVRATDAKSTSKRKPEALMATLEHLLKNPAPIHIFHDTSRLPHKHKYGDSDLHDFGSQLMEHLTPPRPNFLHKNAVRELKPKKRPASRFKNGSRKPMRHSPPRSSPSGLEASSSNVDVHVLHDPSYGTPTRHQFTSFSDAYPGHSSPEILRSLLRELRASSSSNNYDINHPRIHNLLGLMMKNNQLPMRNGYFRERDQLNRYLADEQRRLPLYDDTLDDYSRRSASHMSSLKRNGYSGNGAA